MSGRISFNSIGILRFSHRPPQTVIARNRGHYLDYITNPSSAISKQPHQAPIDPPQSIANHWDNDLVSPITPFRVQ